MILVYLAMALSIYLLVAAAWDRRTLHIPVWRMWQCNMALLPFWLGRLVAWQLKWMSGGDAQVSMGLFGLFPTSVLLCTLLFVAGLGLVVAFVARYGCARALPLLSWRLRFLFKAAVGRGAVHHLPQLSGADALGSGG